MNAEVDSETVWLVTNHLSPDEKLLWCGRPPGKFRLNCGSIFLTIFAIYWSGFAFFWETWVIAKAFAKGDGDGFAPWGMALFGLPFVGVGIILLAVVGTAWNLEWKKRKLTHYGLTDKRALILYGANLTVIELKGLTDVTLQDTGAGCGNIHFGRPQTVRQRHLDLTARLGIRPELTFEGIPRVHEVFQQVQTARLALN